MITHILVLRKRHLHPMALPRHTCPARCTVLGGKWALQVLVGITLSWTSASSVEPSKRDSERLPGPSGRKIASFDLAQDAILLPLALVGNHQILAWPSSSQYGAKGAGTFTDVAARCFVPRRCVV